MAISFTHAFTSAKADGPDSTLIQPSNWNAGHSLSMATARLLGRATVGSGSVEELQATKGLNIAAGVLEGPNVFWGGTSTNVGNAYTITCAVVPAALTAGLTIRAIINAANTGASTVDVNGLGAKDITKNGTTALASGDMALNAVVTLAYDGTQFQLISTAAAGLADASVTLAKMADLANGKIIGRATSGTGVPEALSVSSDFTLTGTTLAVDPSVVSKLGTASSFTKAQRGSVVALTSSSAHIAVDFAAGNNFSHTFTETTTLDNPTNIVAGQSGCITFTQHASSAKTLAFASYWVEVTTGTAPAVSTTTSAQNLLSYYVVDSTHIYYTLNKHGVT